MDGEEDYSGTGARVAKDTTKSQDNADVTFCIGSYLQDAMKVRTF